MAGQEPEDGGSAQFEEGSAELYEARLQELLGLDEAWLSQGASEYSGARLELYDDVRQDALDEQAAEDASDQAVERDLAHADVDEAYQANDLRKSFFWFVVVAVAGVLVASAVLMAAYMRSEWTEIEPGVMIAWYSANVVQVIGLAYIVARYLFAPKSRPQVAAK